MLRLWLLSAARTFLRQKVCTGINLLGLSSGIAFCVLCLSYVRFERGYDTFHQRAASIFLLYPTEGTEHYRGLHVGMSYPLIEAMKTEVPGIARAVRITEAGDDRILTKDGPQLGSIGGLYVEPSFLELFSFPTVAGDRASALRRPDGVVLSRRFALSCFGTADAVGRTVSLRTSDSVSDVVVTAVVEVPAPSSLQFDFLLPCWWAGGEMAQHLSTQWCAWNYPTFVELAPGWRPAEVEARMAAVTRKYREQLYGDIELRLLPLRELHLSPWIDFGLGPAENPLHGYILSGIALAVLLTACVNYTHLSLALAATRTRDIGIRKVLGGTRAHLVRHLWGEAVLQTAVSLTIAAAMVELLLPTFRALVNRDLVIGPGTLALFLGVIGVPVALLSGAYPALVLSGHHPVAALRSRLRFGGRNRPTQALVVAQLAISILLVVVALVIQSQVRYLHARDLGFDRAHLVLVDTYGLDRQQTGRTLAAYRRAAEGDPRLLGVSMSSLRFGEEPGGIGGTYEGRDIGLGTFVVDYDFASTLGIRLLEGRDFSADNPGDARGSILVNASLLRKLGLKSVVGRPFPLHTGMIYAAGQGYDDKTAIGVLQDFDASTSHSTIPSVRPSSPCDAATINCATS